MLTDSHCHLCDMKGYSLNPQITYFTCGYSHETNINTINAYANTPKKNIRILPGISPYNIMKNEKKEDGLEDEWIEFIRKNANEKNIVGIGEIGIDYQYGDTQEKRARMKKGFEKMVGLTEKLNLPVVAHSRKAEEDVIGILCAHDVRFVLHCFGGTLEQAEFAIENGKDVLISVPPIRSKERKKIIRRIDLSHLATESDAPYIGKTPEATAESVRQIAEYKEMETGEVEKNVLENMERVFE